MGDGCVTDQLVKLIIVAEGELQVSGSNGLLIGFNSGISYELKDLTGEVLQDRGHENTSTLACPQSVSALPDVTVAASDGEDETEFARD